MPRGSKKTYQSAQDLRMALLRNNCGTCSARILENKSTKHQKTHQHLTAETLTNAIKIPRYDKAVRDSSLTVT